MRVNAPQSHLRNLPGYPPMQMQPIRSLRVADNGDRRPIRWHVPIIGIHCRTVHGPLAVTFPVTLHVKILHAIPSLNPAEGGPPRIALRLAANTASLGHDVTVFYHDTPAARPAIDQQLAEVTGSDRVHYHILPPQNRLENLLPGEVCKKIDSIINNFDIVHIHSIWDGLSRAAMMSAYRHKVPFVILANGMLDPWSLAQKRLKKR